MVRAIAGYRGEQLLNASIVIAVTESRGLSRQAKVCAVACAMGESSLRNIGYGDWETSEVRNPDGTPTTSVGLFQQQQSWGPWQTRMSPWESTGLFLDRLVRVKEWETLEPTIAIHRVQINADPYHYRKFTPAAEQIVDSLTASPLTEQETGMVVLLAYDNAVDIGGGRGRLAVPAAASLARVDTQIRRAFGRDLDVNEAWRSPQQADENAAAYQRYLKGGPKAPLALPALQSIHCRGYAVDTDDGYKSQAVAILNVNGWFQTVSGNREPWHFEYDPNRDNYRNASTGGTAAGGAEIEEEDTMAGITQQDIVNIVKAEVKPILEAVGRLEGGRAAAGQLLYGQVDNDKAMVLYERGNGVRVRVETPAHLVILARDINDAGPFNDAEQAILNAYKATKPAFGS